MTRDGLKNHTIILIGPIGTGKGAIGQLLSERLNVPRIELDEIRFNYYKEMGYDEEMARHKLDFEGFWSLYRYWKPFEVYSVERVLADYTNCVIDFGAGHSVYEDDELFKRVQQVLAPYPNIVLILPSADPDESIAILNTRVGDFVRDIKPSLIEHFVRHPSNYELAKFIVYTLGKTPGETCDEVLSLLKI